MPSCELCGMKNSIYECEIEGTMMKVCENCSRFGRVIGKSNVKIVVQESKRPEIKEPEYAFVQGYGLIVKNARERSGMKQEDFAKKINEHKSLIHQVESEHITPNVELAKKLEKALHIKIINEIKDEETPNARRPAGKSNAPEGFTLGDMIKKR